MNLIGKILVVLILVMSVLFMGLAMAVYATHSNWRAAAESLEKRVAELSTQYKQAQDSYDRLDSQFEGEKEAAQQQIRKLETAREALAARNTDFQKQLDQLKQESREAIAAVKATQQNNDRLASEAVALRESIRENELARDESFVTTLRATEERNQLEVELEKSRQAQSELTEQVAGMTNVMRAEGIDPATDPDGVVPRVGGFVTGLRQTSGVLYVEVSIGADDGLKPKHTVQLYRGDKYLGQAEILRTSPDRAVGRVDRRFQQGSIQEGDRVATRLELS